MLNKNNFMQNARNSLFKKQWTIFMRKQWTVLVNKKTDFMNAVSRFEYTVDMMRREQILLM